MTLKRLTQRSNPRYIIFLRLELSFVGGLNFICSEKHTNCQTVKQTVGVRLCSENKALGQASAKINQNNWPQNYERGS